MSSTFTGKHMQFFKLSTLAALLLAFNTSSQEVSSEEEFMQQQDALSKKYTETMTKRGLFEGIVPAGQDNKNENGGEERFLEKYQRSIENMKEKTARDGNLKGIGKTEIDPNKVAVAPDFLETQENMLKKWTAQFKEAGYLDGLDEKSIEERTQQFKNAAQLTAQQSNSGLAREIKKEFGLDMGGKSAFDAETPYEPQRLKGIFISFSMSKSAIREAMKVGVSQGAQLFLKGMHKDDTGIHDTMRRLRAIGQGLKHYPDVRFKPRYFEKYDVTVAPSILYSEDDKFVTASGLMNPNWAMRRFNEGEYGDKGTLGDTLPVEEKDIRKEFKDRFAAMDFEGKKERVVKNFWKKKEFVALPEAKEDARWFIDVRGTAAKDVINPRGDKLASAGQVLNPIENMTTPLTLYIFDPMKPRQLEWVSAKYHKERPLGQSMIIFSRLNKEKGWDHLNALRKSLGQELYELPSELVRRFNITHLPVKISTDFERNLMLVEQFKMEN